MDGGSASGAIECAEERVCFARRSGNRLTVWEVGARDSGVKRAQALPSTRGPFVGAEPMGVASGPETVHLQLQRRGQRMTPLFGLTCTRVR